jgi:ribosomal protein S18 acetylase RimI-like enzyme
VPERWGEGIGALLIDRVLSEARLRGFSRISLLTHDDNDRAQTLYRSRGFERTGWSRMSTDPRNGIVSEWARGL